MGDIHGQEGGSQLWLITFTDVMALMLTFFVLLFSMSQPQEENWSTFSAALSSEFNRFLGMEFEQGGMDEINLERLSYEQALDLNYLKALMETVLEGSDALGDVTMETRDGRLMMSLPEDLLFEPGQADVSTEGARAIYALGGALSRIKNQIEVVGHTDPRPPGTGAAYNTNWSLSLARAANVAVILTNVGYRKDIVVRGMAESRYDDLDEGLDPQERQRLSRRVDIVIMNHAARQSRLWGDG
ncbi:MAG: flagellar motor protein MotB [Alphaproteobacteria bacterium]|nr:flagellar motor protein MotB [Alphaproteobacteria bacterium]